MPKIQMRRDTAENWKTNNPTLLAGEWALETDTRKMKMGDGTTPYNLLPYTDIEDEAWHKPIDWVDIRSGALDNSIYLLVAHSVPTESGGVYSIANYPKYSFRVSLESEGTSTADIFVDGIKLGVATNMTSYVIDWESLYNSGKVQTIYTTTHPSSLAYHIVRITPTTSTDKIVWLRTIGIANQIEQGIMWAHYQLDNAINMSSAFGSPSSIRNYLLEAVTSKNNKIIYKCSASDSSSGFYSAFSACTSLVQIPILEAENKNYPSGVYTAFQGVPAKKVTIKNNTGLETIYCLSGTTIQEIDVENGFVLNNGSTASINIQCTKLKKFPNISQLVEGEYLVLSRFDSLNSTVINDLSTVRKHFRFYGTSSHRTDGLKGLTVSNQAPFDSDSSPQININYTGLNRAALVTLFKSLPTVSASQVCSIVGATGAADLTAADLAIATAKGWTITR